MQFATLVSIVLTTLPLVVFGTGPHVTGTVCDTITSSVDYKSAFASCIVPACLEIKPVSLQCGCTTIPTITVSQTACPTCAGTSYVTAIVDCFPTSTPPSSSTSHSSSPSLTSSSTTSVSTTDAHSSSTPTPTPSSSSGPASTSSTTSTSKSPPSSPSTTPIPSTTLYTNTTETKTKTETHIITLTTCPVSVTCTGQTVTFTSTEVCPTSTCTCVLPSVTVITTLLPGGQSATTVITTPRGSNTPPSPTASLRPTFSQGVAAGGVEVGMGALGAFALAMLGMI